MRIVLALASCIGLSAMAGKDPCKNTLTLSLLENRSTLAPLQVRLPTQLLTRTTRLQTILSRTTFDSLHSAPKNPRVSELLQESGASDFAWPKLLGNASYALGYVEYFDFDDLIYMAAHEKYAKKIAGELRAYANVHLGGATTQFRNETLYAAAKILVDRWRIKEAGFRAITTLDDFRKEAATAGAPVTVKSKLYLLTKLAPKDVKKLDVIRPAGVRHVGSILEAFPYPRGVQGAPSLAFLPLEDDSETTAKTLSMTTTDAKRVFVAFVKSFPEGTKGPFVVETVKRAAEESGRTVDQVIHSIDAPSTGFQYEVEKIPAVKAGTFNVSWLTHEVPVARITRVRRFSEMTVRYEIPVSRGYGDRRDTFEMRTEWVRIFEPWEALAR